MIYQDFMIEIVLQLSHVFVIQSELVVFNFPIYIKPI